MTLFTPADCAEKGCKVDEEMRNMHKALGKILDRLTAIETTLSLRADFDRRIRELETMHVALQTEMRSKAKVIATVAGTVASIAVSVISALLIWHFKG